MARDGSPVLAPGPLAPLLDGYVGRLTALGYVSSGLGGQRGLVAHLDRWMGAAGLELADLTPTVLEEFLRARAAEGYVTKLTKGGLTPLVEYLEELGLYVAPDASVTGVDRLVGRFRQHLVEEHGLGDATVANHERVARRFLALRPLPVEVSVAALTAGDVTAFVLARSRELSVDGMQTVVGGMRALLQFLYAAGLVDRALASAVPTVARRRQELPRALPGGHVELLLGACDRATPVGARDFAILVLLARLGLRANEVAGLRLDDIDWAAGEVRIRGKGPPRSPR